MNVSGLDLVDRFGKLMADGDTTALTLMYAQEAKVVLPSGVAAGRGEIGNYLDRSLRVHGRYDIVSIDQFQDADDVVMWDATVETETGLLQTTHIVVRDDEGLITRHFPGVRGYWGM